MNSLEASEVGLHLSQSLQQLLESLPDSVEEKLVEGVSKCFGRGHPLPEEASCTKSTEQLIQDFCQQLDKDPSRRHFVVDRDSLVTDDAGWLALARAGGASLSYNNNNNKDHPPLQWCINTVRSLERSRNSLYRCRNRNLHVGHDTQVGNLNGASLTCVNRGRPIPIQITNALQAAQVHLCI